MITEIKKDTNTRINSKNTQRAGWNKEANVEQEREMQQRYRNSKKMKLKFWKWKGQ
jgi:hypothetical protein